jgi:hypothetical protein
VVQGSASNLAVRADISGPSVFPVNCETTPELTLHAYSSEAPFAATALGYRWTIQHIGSADETKIYTTPIVRLPTTDLIPGTTLYVKLLVISEALGETDSAVHEVTIT